MTNAVMDHLIGAGGRRPSPGAWSTRACIGLVAAVGVLVLSAPTAAAQAQDTLYLTAADTTAYPAVEVTVAVQPGRTLDSADALTPEALALTEDGAPRSLTVTPVSGEQLETALLIDTSRELGAEAFGAQVSAAVELVLRLPPGARVGVVTTGAPAAVAAPLTEDVAAVLSVLGALQPGDGAALSDGVPLALAELAGTGAPAAALVAFSGGQDNASTAALDEAVEELTGSGVALYGVPLAGGGADDALAGLVSGAQGQLLETDGSLVAATDRIAAQLQNSYVLAYTSEGEGPTQVQVEAEEAGFTGEATRTLALPAAPDEPAGGTRLPVPRAAPPQPPAEPAPVVPPEASDEPVTSLALLLATAVGLLAVGALAVARAPVLTRPRAPRPGDTRPPPPPPAPPEAPRPTPVDRRPRAAWRPSPPRRPGRSSLAVFALLALVLVEVTNAGTVLPDAGPLNVYIATLALAGGALVLGVVRGRLHPGWSPLYLLVAIYFVTQLVSMVVAADTAVGWADVVTTAKDLVFLLVVTALLSATRQYGQVVRAVVLATTALAGLTIVNELLLDDVSAFAGFSQIPLPVQTGVPIARHSGPQADPNFWARTLLLFIPLALSLGAARDGRRPRTNLPTGWGWLLAAGILTVGVYLTQSRGALVALVLILAVWVLFAGRRYRRSVLLLAPVALAVVLLVPGVGSRLLTLQDLGDARSAVGDASLVERVALQEVGVAIVAANPGLGVGPGNFDRVFDDFSSTSDVQPRGVDGAYAPHNLYLELLSEGGVVGLTGWLVLYGGALLLSMRAFLLTSRDPTSSSARIRWLALGAGAGLLGWAAASAFLHLTHFRVLMVPLALVAVLDERAREQVRVAPRLPAAGVALRAPGRRRASVVAVATWSVVVLVGSLVLDLRPAAWSTRYSALVLPRSGAATDFDAYALDLLSRQPVMPTFAAIVASPRFQTEAADRLGLAPAARDDVEVGVLGSPQSTAVTVVATSSDRRLADDMSRGVLESGRSYVNSLGRLFVVSPPSSSQTASSEVHRLRWGALLPLLAGATVVAAFAYRRAARRRGDVAS